MFNRDPVNGCPDLAAIRRIAALACRIIGAAQLGDFAGAVLHHFATRDEIGIAQAHFAAGRHPEEFLFRNFHEVFLLDVKLAREFDLAGTAAASSG